MKFLEVKSYDELSEKAAEILAEQIKTKPNSILGLATGSTPIGTYKKLIEKNNNGEIDFSKITSINLDEYIGLDANNDQSYRYFMNNNLFNHVNINKENTFVPNGMASDLDEEGKNYDKLIENYGGIDLQILGIGLDGHIGFNEPDNKFEKNTHVVDLDQSTIEANARFFNSIDEVPKKAISMGMLPIMQAKKVLLLANGEAKKEILMKSITGPITPEVPASILQLHKDLTVIFSEN